MDICVDPNGPVCQKFALSICVVKVSPLLEGVMCGVFVSRVTDCACCVAGVNETERMKATPESTSLRAAVADINSLAKGIALANQRLVELKGLGQPANDLLDERDRLISNLAQQVHITRMDSDDGSV